MAFPVLVIRSCYIIVLLFQFTAGLHCPSIIPHYPSVLPSTKRNPNESTRRYGVLDDFIEEAYLERSTSIGEKPVMFAGEDTPGSFDFKRWEKHRSSKRYGRMLIGVLFGSTTRRVAPTVLLLVAFSAVVDFYDYRAEPLLDVVEFPSNLSYLDLSVVLPQLQLPIIPFELTAPVLGLLLVFRTDAAYSRFNSGSELTWEITACARNTVRRLAAWTARDGCSGKERDAGHDLIDACCILHGWIMGEYLKGDEFADLYPDQSGSERRVALLRKALGAGGTGGDGTDGASDAELELMGEEMTPSLAMTAISLGAARRLPSLTDQEHIAIDDGFAETTKALANCEKLLRTPIPLGYTRYAVRFLTIWLILLPFALVRPFNEFGEQPVLVLAMLFISAVFLAIEDIAVQIEEPFVTLPLELHQKWLLWDAEQVRRLMRWSSKRCEGDLSSVSVDNNRVQERQN